jgi:hypothetical protein
MLLAMIAVGAAHALIAVSLSNEKSAKKADISMSREQLVIDAKEQLFIIFGAIAALALPGLLFYVDQKTGIFSEHSFTTGTVIACLVILEHAYAWRAYGFKSLEKWFSLIIACLTVFFAFVPVFGLNLYPPSSQLVSELLLFLYLPLCWSSNFRKRKGWL